MSHNVGAHAGDLECRIGVDIARTVVLAGCIDFLVAEGGEVDGGVRFGCAVAVSVEHVYANYGFGLGEGEERQARGEGGCQHGGEVSGGGGGWKME